ncbi:carboxylating nicotinate-nucleotide diphosphorylase [Frankia sp. AgB1.9]|uniref:carboxylating nicotinate-nucleotide diphosphorylase n=1 Tax=unclassified Frankia TaxID=2632575 RepID=UPI001932EB5C|nr:MULTISPECIES: carboxylating nicotinate-nucleotide diphosphorylase [unclassified Frankia]MBL7491935.1 carboxylating nicotinate-nucleotide diphosphorylase [Frankia sp. AgW1.1]MBL7546950.1 carboxylating nicotinate-nucleotide diphosphorylase [Frankia sp. AgB1.9]MBL7620617.1 carboxylating nicotinate-nucleotide diphosphorylase [Frankia sp. AgB1.8]
MKANYGFGSSPSSDQATLSRRPGWSATTEKALMAAGLDPSAVGDVVARAIAEDLPAASGLGVDVTSAATVPADLVAVGRIVSRARGVVAGLPVAAAVFDAMVGPDAEVTLTAADGDRIGPGTEVLRVRGPVRGLLTAERTALNLLCHLSGVATATRAWADAIAGTGAAVRDTRKTTPGLRALEKYAVRAGGGVNHRMSLVDAALVKDNHVVAAGGVAAAFAAVRAAFPDLPVEVECDTVEQVREAVTAGADLILLDNMTPDELRAAVALARAASPRAKNGPPGVLLEASGGLTIDVAASVAATGVDYLSVGGITHSVTALDLGLDLTLDK